MKRLHLGLVNTVATWREGTVVMPGWVGAQTDKDVKRGRVEIIEGAI